jgi:hypothetical protein
MSAERRLRAKRLEEELEADLDLDDIDELMRDDGGDNDANGDGGDEVDIDGAGGRSCFFACACWNDWVLARSSAVCLTLFAFVPTELTRTMRELK